MTDLILELTEETVIPFDQTPALPVEDITILERPHSAVQITASITRHYGQISIELGATMSVIIMRPEEFGQAYSDLFDHVTEQHRQMAAKLVAESGKTKATVQPSTENPEGDNVIAIESVVVEKKAGKKYFAVKGGRFSKFGVRLWLDKNVTADIADDWKLHELPEGEHKPPMPMKAVIEFEGEKPKKISRIFRNMVQDEISF